MRKGIAGLASLTQDVLHQKPTSGAVFAFRGRRGDRIKLLYWEGPGILPLLQSARTGSLPLVERQRWSCADDRNQTIGTAVYAAWLLPSGCRAFQFHGSSSSSWLILWSWMRSRTSAR